MRLCVKVCHLLTVSRGRVSPADGDVEALLGPEHELGQQGGLQLLGRGDGGHVEPVQHGRQHQLGLQQREPGPV